MKEIISKFITKKNKKKIYIYSLSLLGFLLALLFSLPFIYMVFMSVHKDSNSIFTWPPKIIPDKFYFENFINAYNYINMTKLIKNTLILVVSSMAIGISSSILVAYGFARMRSKYSNVLFSILLSTMMIPWVVTMIPAYTEFEFLGWIGTRYPLIIPWIGGSAFNIFMLRQFIMGIPKELDEAAKIDGCNSFTILIRIILPQLKPVLATLLVFSFINTWSDYVGPSIYLQDSELHTLSLGIQAFFSATGTANWAHVMAASLIFSIPMVLVLFLAQKAFVRGVVTSGIK